MPSRIIQGQCYPMMTIIDSEAFHGLRVTVAVGPAGACDAAKRPGKIATRDGEAGSWSSISGASLAVIDDLIKDEFSCIHIRVSDSFVLWFFIPGCLGQLWSLYSTSTWRPGG